MADFKAELGGVSVSFNKEYVSSMTEKEFVELYMADEAMYTHSSKADKKRALHTVYRACNPKATAPKDPEPSGND